MKKEFENADELILYLLGTNRGTQNFIDKDELVNIAEKKGIYLSKGISKKEILNILAENIGVKELISFVNNIGISSFALQERYKISNYDVKKLAKQGYFAVTGYETFNKCGKTFRVNLYSPYDYFKPYEEVHSKLSR